MVAAARKQKGILDYFPPHLEPRDIQINTLLKIQEAWKDSDIIVVNLPVASGKSAIANTIAAWAGRAAIITPNNLLVEQYRRDYPKLASLIGSHLYRCSDKVTNQKLPFCTGRKKAVGKHCQNCPYVKDLRRMRNPYQRSYVVNYYMYMAICTQWSPSKYMPTLIVDEAHNLIPFLQDLHSLHLTQSKWKYPDNPDSPTGTEWVNRKQLREWVSQLVDVEALVDKSTAFRALVEELNTNHPKFILKYGTVAATDRATGVEIEKPALKMMPLDVSEQPQFLWPKQHVQKLVLMSATINTKDIELLGLANRRVTMIEADSCIPKEQRPVLPIGSLPISKANLARALPELAKDIKGILAAHPNERGLIHINYDMAQRIRPYLKGEDRLLWHSKSDKSKKYQEFRERLDQPLVLMASGMYEGIDLPQEYGQFQAVTKVPWPYLGEPAVRYRCQTDPDWYTWETVKSLLQACGRICRGPDDYGVTYILDKTFDRLYKEADSVLPKWWKNSIEWG